MIELSNLWVPLSVLGLIILAAIFSAVVVDLRLVGCKFAG